MVYHRRLKEAEKDQFVLDVADSCAASYGHCDGNFYTQYTQCDEGVCRVIDKNAPRKHH